MQRVLIVACPVDFHCDSWTKISRFFSILFNCFCVFYRVQNRTIAVIKTRTSD